MLLSLQLWGRWYVCDVATAQLRAEIPSAATLCSPARFFGLQKKAELPALDTWLTAELPVMVRGRAGSGGKLHISQPELSRIMKWKLMKGRMRPLQKRIDALRDADVVAASSAAFKHAAGGREKAAIEALTVLGGVGPATATAVLAPLFPQLIAFMSDEALEAVLGSREYTLAEGLALSKALREFAAELNAREALSGASPAGAAAAAEAAASEASSSKVPGPPAGAASSKAHIGAGGTSRGTDSSSEGSTAGRGLWTANAVQRAIYAHVKAAALGISLPGVATGSTGTGSSSSGAAGKVSDVGSASAEGPGVAAAAPAEKRGTALRGSPSRRSAGAQSAAEPRGSDAACAAAAAAAKPKPSSDGAARAASSGVAAGAAPNPVADVGIGKKRGRQTAERDWAAAASSSAGKAEVVIVDDEEEEDAGKGKPGGSSAGSRPAQRTAASRGGRSAAKNPRTASATASSSTSSNPAAAQTSRARGGPGGLTAWLQREPPRKQAGQE
jgi:hypothetical protein